MVESALVSEAFRQCETDGMYLTLESVPKGRVRAMVRVAQEDIAALSLLEGAGLHNTMFKIAYDALHTLAGALLLAQKIKPKNHQCLFAYVCSKFPALRIDWGICEQMRSKRNKLHYYGSVVRSAEWKGLEVQMLLYAEALCSEIAGLLD
ncbi:hypothetical protein COY28_06770 [Candidatus Woesearchaeota archaeon CG_4_10_14_0_2_um_filter_57_5]|nr:MAG: hypothetical protein AUJ68_01830 [Candidatus Woesearchaeota archaeon CG1_02_57_44]PIN70532.1 MAG: hypothetical protein COV94_01590 [Candidatus Woesearchaeota archaeon CG11_big_fil_rev_8_21_14_0_20_57_5]PIZ48927.1 MAG: hypothetical protein COY28_06770 [Candidatus Woesearchaeota archaeon CG_4_10_14_0_2_um_filter_57_5]